METSQATERLKQDIALLKEEIESVKDHVSVLEQITSEEMYDDLQKLIKWKERQEENENKQQ